MSSASEAADRIQSKMDGFFGSASGLAPTIRKATTMAEEMKVAVNCQVGRIHQLAARTV